MFLFSLLMKQLIINGLILFIARDATKKVFTLAMAQKLTKKLIRRHINGYPKRNHSSTIIKN